MSLLDLLRGRRKKSANIAKERLQIIISHERNQRRSGPDYIAKLQDEILHVIAKYIDINPDQVKVQLEREGENDILVLNVTLPEEEIAE